MKPLFIAPMTFSLAFVVTATLAVQWLAPPQVHATTPTVETLVQQGYSPESVEMTLLSQARAEGRGIVPPKLGPIKQMLQNVWTGNVTDGADPFGYTLIRRH